eukprot:g15066.t1
MALSGPHCHRIRKTKNSRHEVMSTSDRKNHNVTYWKAWYWLEKLQGAHPGLHGGHRYQTLTPEAQIALEWSVFLLWEAGSNISCRSKSSRRRDRPDSQEFDLYWRRNCRPARGTRVVLGRDMSEHVDEGTTTQMLLVLDSRASRDDITLICFFPCNLPAYLLQKKTSAVFGRFRFPGSLEWSGPFKEFLSSVKSVVCNEYLPRPVLALSVQGRFRKNLSTEFMHQRSVTLGNTYKVSVQLLYFFGIARSVSFVTREAICSYKASLEWFARLMKETEGAIPKE